MVRTTDEYRIIADRAGWIGRSPRGRLRIDGRDAAPFLHALFSNDVRALQPGGGVYATYLTPQGRLLADPIVYHCGESLLLDVAPGQAASLAARLDRAIFAEDVRIEDVSASIDQIGVIGGAAGRIVARAMSVAVEALEALAPHAHLAAADGRIARQEMAVLPSFDVFVPADGRASVIARLEEAGAVAMSDELADALRIDAGRPAFGVDMTEETIPLEAGLLERAISLSKGCYVGQEVIVRVLHRGGGRVAKRLVRIAFAPDIDAPIAVGQAIATDAGDVGRVTSAAWSPRENRAIALGYVHRDAAEVGRRVRLGEAAGEIVGFAG
jgi:tRNA-modifying protein YgfZ